MTRRVRVAAMAAAAMMPTVAASAWTEQDAVARTGAGALHGTLTLPGNGGAAAGPGVLILPGSGPVDRDGNAPGAPNDSLKLLARGLADQGIASLRIDKRGIGASQSAGEQERDLCFDAYVTDAAAWLDVLQADPHVSHAVLLGHSEGALVATLVAERSEVAGLILVAGAGEPAGRLIERQLAAAGVPSRLQDSSRRIVAALEEGRTVPDVPPELAPLFRPSVQPYLASWLSIDPATELARVRAPVLVLQGTTDLQVSMEDARRLAAARPGAKLAVINGMNHMLKPAPPERAANLATYADPTLPLAPGLLKQIVAFLDPGPVPTPASPQ